MTAYQADLVRTDGTPITVIGCATPFTLDPLEKANCSYTLDTDSLADPKIEVKNNITVTPTSGLNNVFTATTPLLDWGDPDVETDASLAVTDTSGLVFDFPDSGVADLYTDTFKCEDIL